MKKSKTQEIKRKIDSKIFELQSTLLSEDAGSVDENLLRECTLWFRPQHMQDIVIERSEAEGRCGWPGCGKTLPPWRLSAPLVFDLPEGEQLGRFCERSCMVKTKIFLSAIPPTSPYSRENLVRVVCPLAPEPTGKSTGVTGGGAAALEGGERTKKVYKRARRRDIPPPKRSPADVTPAAAFPSSNAGSRENSGVIDDRRGEERKGSETLETGGANDAGSRPVPKMIASNGEVVPTSALVPARKGDKKVDRKQEERRRSGVGALAGTAKEGAVDCVVDNGGRGGGCGGSTEASSRCGGASENSVADGDTAFVQAAFEKVSISEQQEEKRGAVESPSVGASVAPPTSGSVAGNAAAAAAAAAVPHALPPVAGAPRRSAQAPGTAWENMRLDKTSVGSSTSGRGGVFSSCSTASVVSRHASLAAAAAEVVMANNAATAAATVCSESVGTKTSTEKSRSAECSSAEAAAPAPALTKLQASDNEDSPTTTADAADSDAATSQKASETVEKMPSRAKSEAAGTSGLPSQARRKTVSFADGTKESDAARNSSSPPMGSSRGKVAAARQAAAAAAAARGSRGKGGQAGRAAAGGTAAGRGSGKKAAARPPRKNVLGGVVERAPAVPTPMQVAVGDGSGDRDGARNSAGMVEGHLPKIEADLSFRVMPRGGFPGVSSAEEKEEENSLGDYELGVDGGPLTKDEVEEELEEGHEDGGEADNQFEADENDRTIWRETFGEEMPEEADTESWMDMDAVRDKEMREEFASSIAPFALIWSALSEWVTPETRAVCRAGRAAAAAVNAAALRGGELAGASGASNEMRTVCRVEDSSVVRSATVATAAAAPSYDDAGNTEARNADDACSSKNNGESDMFASSRRLLVPPAGFQARKAGAVARGVEAEAARRNRRGGSRRLGEGGEKDGGKGNSDRGGSGEGKGPSLTGALRHGGVSTMVNMHLAQAERALRMAGGSDGERGFDGGNRDAHQGARDWKSDAGSPSNLIWSDSTAGSRRVGGARVPVPRSWLEGEAAAAATMAATAVPLRTTPSPLKTEDAPEGSSTTDHGNPAGAAVMLPRAKAQEGPVSRDNEGDPPTARDGSRRLNSSQDKDQTESPDTAGGAESRRAVAGVIDTLDTENASSAATLSIAQWKVVALVLLTAVGLGGGAVGGGSGGCDTPAGGYGDGDGHGGVELVGNVEVDGAAEACVSLCGSETSISASEFRILVEAMLVD